MSDRYNQYRILYCLYDAHFNGQINSIDIMTLMQHESLKYIVRNKLIGEIFYLYGHGLIGIDGISSPFVKITSRGIDNLGQIPQLSERHKGRKSRWCIQ